MPNKVELLDFYLTTGFFDSLLEGLGVVLRNAFLYSLRSSIYEFLSFLQAKTASFLNSLYNLKLSSTGALQYYIERSLFFYCFGSTGSSTTCNSNSCSSRLDTIIFLQYCNQIIYFLYCQIYQFFSNSFNICHFILN